MQYTKTLTTKTGSELYLRNGDAPDGDAALAVFNKTHAETEYLLTYPDESSMTAEQEAEFLAQATKSAREIEILAFVDGQLAGTAGISAVGKPCKLVHRAEFGIGILQVGLSLKSHDPSQRANGILTVAGGIVITFTKEILTLITG